MSSSLFTLNLVTAVACGLIGGVFFAFSTFVMTALGRIPAPQGIASMQSINITVINPLFLAALFGAAAGSLAVAIAALVTWDESAARYMLAGGVLYLAGTIVPTILANVPRNETLAPLDPNDPEAAIYWARYLSSWTAWNHVRTVAALAASTLLIWGIRAG